MILIGAIGFPSYIAWFIIYQNGLLPRWSTYMLGQIIFSSVFFAGAMIATFWVLRYSGMVSHGHSNKRSFPLTKLMMRGSRVSKHVHTHHSHSHVPVETQDIVLNALDTGHVRTETGGEGGEGGEENEKHLEAPSKGQKKGGHAIQVSASGSTRASGRRKKAKTEKEKEKKKKKIPQ